MRSKMKFRASAIMLAMGVVLYDASAVESLVILGRDGTEQQISLEDLIRQKGAYIRSVSRDEAGNAVLVLRKRDGCKPGPIYYCQLHTKDVRTDAEAVKR